jgi:site-specific DNA-methyltransferase (cytosine-N4-specific)
MLSSVLLYVTVAGLIMDFDKDECMKAIRDAYINNGGTLEQSKLYKDVSDFLSIDPSDFYAEVGKQKKVNLFYRHVRWCQQSLKSKKLLMNVGKGVWEVSGKDKDKLRTISQGKSVLALSTSLGIMICSKTESVFGNGVIDDEVHLVLSSPPYILQNSRNYGGHSEAKEWVEFIMSVIGPILPRLADGASIALNVGQDSFHKAMPARQTHIERLILTMEDAGLWLIDRMIWSSNKAPTPYAWTSLNRYMLRASYEFVLHFSNNPLKLRSCNQNVLEPHTEAHKKFVLRGGCKQEARNSDGAHIKSIGDYSKTDLNKGKIPTNNMYFANKCARNEMVNRFARERNLPVHGAKMPYKLAEFLVKFLSMPGDLIVDPFGGTGTVASACEENERRWISFEPVFEYIKQSFVRFTTLHDDVWINPLFKNN